MEDDLTAWGADLARRVGGLEIGKVYADEMLYLARRVGGLEKAKSRSSH